MKPVRSVKNQYRGVNAHLHSLWQGAYGWNNFHTPHITALAIALKARLLPMGYTTAIEDSLQVRRADEYSRRPKSDITIYDLVSARHAQPISSSAGQLTGVVLPLAAALDANPVSEKPYAAVTIHRLGEWHERAKPIAWLELLSPSNKRPGDDSLIYLSQRDDLLASGIVFVEIDYLHESPPTLPTVLDYSDGASRQQPKAYPYRILVLDPRPDVRVGHASINEFHVDDPIPEVAIPLSGDEILRFDFGLPYHKQFTEMLYGLEDVDYSQLPLNFDRYRLADQARIAVRMLAVLEAARAGVDLETAPLPVKDVPLDDALAQLEALRST